MYNPFIILVVADVGSYAEVQSIVAFLMVRTSMWKRQPTPCRVGMCLGSLCRYRHLEVAGVSPVSYRIT